MYNPFDKDFKEIKEKDLEILKNISEGFYIEHKTEFTDKKKGKKIAKSISSFANSYGGIFFYGIKSDQTKNNFAKDIIGVSESKDFIRDSVRGNVHPFPFFETYEIPLKNNKKILMAVIPEGEDTPYVHSNGRMYRRQESASDPIPETDRHTIDMLYQKAEKFRKKIKEFRRIDYSFCEDETKPHLAIFINTKTFDQFELTYPFYLDKKIGQEILSKFSEKYTISGSINDEEISLSGSIPFNMISTYSQSIALRQMLGRDLAYNGLTIEIDLHGNVKILIPLNYSEINFDNPKEPNEKKYADFIGKNHSTSLDILSFLNAYDTFGVVVGTIDRYLNFIISHGYKDDLEVKLLLTNSWRTTLHFSSEHFIDYIENCGLPICMKDEQEFPEYPYVIKIEEYKKNPIMEPLTIFSLISTALGVPSGISYLALLDEIRSKNQLIQSQTKTIKNSK